MSNLDKSYVQTSETRRNFLHSNLKEEHQDADVVYVDNDSKSLKKRRVSNTELLSSSSTTYYGLGSFERGGSSLNSGPLLCSVPQQSSITSFFRPSTYSSRSLHGPTEHNDYTNNSPTIPLISINYSGIVIKKQEEVKVTLSEEQQYVLGTTCCLIET
jgi:hypothetical protein